MRPFLKAVCAIAAFAGTNLIGSEVSACFYPQNEAHGNTRGPLCSHKRVVKGDHGTEGLSEAVDLSNGFVLQRFFTSYDHMIIVSDCEQVSAAVLGPLDLDGHFGCILEGEEILAHEKAVAKAPLTKATEYAEVSAARAELNLSELVDRFGDSVHEAKIINTDKRIRLSMFDQKPNGSYDLSCACKTYYPTLSGATK